MAISNLLNFLADKPHLNVLVTVELSRKYNNSIYINIFTQHYTIITALKTVVCNCKKTNIKEVQAQKHQKNCGFKDLFF